MLCLHRLRHLLPRPGWRSAPGNTGRRRRTPGPCPADWLAKLHEIARLLPPRQDDHPERQSGD